MSGGDQTSLPNESPGIEDGGDEKGARRAPKPGTRQHLPRCGPWGLERSRHADRFRLAARSSLHFAVI